MKRLLYGVMLPATQWNRKLIGDIITLQRIEDFSFLSFGDVYGFITTNGMRTINRLSGSRF